MCRDVQKRIEAQNIYVFIRIQCVFIRIYPYSYVFNTAYLYWAQYVSKNPTDVAAYHTTYDGASTGLNTMRCGGWRWAQKGCILPLPNPQLITLV
jgi:hypothetical protein